MAKDFSLTNYFREKYIKEALSRDNNTYVTPTTGIKKSTSEYLTDKRKSNPQKETDAMRSSTFTSYDKDGAQPYLTEISQRAKNLVDGYELEDLERNLEQVYRDMEEEAEPEGGPIADQYADEIHAYDEAIRFIKNKGSEKAQRAVGSGPDGEMTYGDMLHKHYPDKYGPGGIAKDKDTFTKSSKFKKAGKRSGFDMRGLKENDYDIKSKYSEGEVKYSIGVDDDYEGWVDVAFQKGFTYDEGEDQWYGPVDEGSCGYTPDGEPRDKPAGPHLLKLKEIIFNSFKK